MDTTTKEKLKPYSSIFVFAAYTVVALIWGRFFLGGSDAMGYSLIVLFLLTPVFASYSAYQLASKTNFLTAAAALLLYVAANEMIQTIVFRSTFHIEPIRAAVVLVPGGICLLFGALKKFKSRSKSESE